MFSDLGSHTLPFGRETRIALIWAPVLRPAGELGPKNADVVLQGELFELCVFPETLFAARNSSWAESRVGSLHVTAAAAILLHLQNYYEERAKSLVA